MKVAFALLLVVVVAAALSPAEKVRYDAARARLSSVQNAAHQQLTQVSRRSGLASEECNAALIAFVGYAGENPAVVDFFSAINDDALDEDSCIVKEEITCFEDLTGAEQLTSLKGFCVEHREEFELQVIALGDACADDAEFEGEDIIGAFKLVLEIMCSKGEGEDEYCFLELAEFDDAPEPLTAEFLDDFCAPCTAIIFKALTSWQPEVAAEVGFFIDLACTTYGDTYCLLEFQAIDALPHGTDAEFVNIVERVCETRCVPKVVAKAKQFNEDVEEYNLGYNVLCNTDGASPPELCITKVFNSLIDLDLGTHCDEEFCDGTNATVGANQCQDDLNAFIDTTGCCGTNWLYLGQDGDNVTGSDIEDAVNAHCSHPDGTALEFEGFCPGFVESVVEYVVFNVDCDWYSEAENQAAFDAALRADIAGAMGIDVDNEALLTLEVTCQAYVSSASAEGERRLLAGEGQVVVSVGTTLETQAFSDDAHEGLMEMALYRTGLLVNEEGGRADTTRAVGDEHIVIAVDEDEDGAEDEAEDEADEDEDARSGAAVVSVGVATLFAAGALLF